MIFFLLLIFLKKKKKPQKINKIILYRNKNKLFNRIIPIVYPEHVKVKIVKDKDIECKKEDIKPANKKTEQHLGLSLNTFENLSNI